MEEIKVKMKMSEIRLAYVRLAEIIKEKRLFSGDVNLAMARNNMTLERAVKCYDDSLKTYVDRYALKDDAGNPVILDDRYTFETMENESKYRRAVSELEETEMEIAVQKVQYKTALDGRHEEPTAYDLVALDFMLIY